MSVWNKQYAMIVFYCTKLKTLQNLNVMYSNSSFWIMACFPLTQRCEASYECMNNCRDTLPWFHCLGPPTKQIRPAYIWCTSFTKTEGTSKRTSIVTWGSQAWKTWFHQKDAVMQFYCDRFMDYLKSGISEWTT